MRQRSVASVNTDAAASHGTFVSYSGGAAFRFAANAIYLQRVCVSGRYKTTPFPLLISSHPPEAVSARDESFHLLLWVVETGFSEPNASCAGFKRALDGNSKHPILHFSVGWKDNYGAISGPVCP